MIHSLSTILMVETRVCIHMFKSFFNYTQFDGKIKLAIAFLSQFQIPTNTVTRYTTRSQFFIRLLPNN